MRTVYASLALAGEQPAQSAKFDREQLYSVIPSKSEQKKLTKRESNRAQKSEKF